MIFDLWETLIDWDQGANSLMHRRVHEVVGFDVQERWNLAVDRYTKPVREVLAHVGIPHDALDEVVAIRSDFVRTCLVPRDGAVETLRALRDQGIKLGLITVCTEEVELVWPESEFADLFDVEVFSNSIGMSKPDPRIYEHCCRELGVEPREAVFVGDGANDELEGARRLGMKAILIHKPGQDPLWPDVREWDGPRVTSIPGVLDVLPGL